MTHRVISGERQFGREMGLAYLRATAETWADRLSLGEKLPTEPIVSNPLVLLAEVDERGCRVGSQTPFPSDMRCFGEAVRGSCRVRATWPGEMGRGKIHARKLFLLELITCCGAGVLFLVGVIALWCEVRRERKVAREQIDYVAGVSHRLKTPLTSISLCAELAKTGRLDTRRQEESRQTIIDEATKLNAIVNEVLDHVKDMRRG